MHVEIRASSGEGERYKQLEESWGSQHQWNQTSQSDDHQDNDFGQWGYTITYIVIILNVNSQHSNQKKWKKLISTLNNGTKSSAFAIFDKYAGLRTRSTTAADGATLPILRREEEPRIAVMERGEEWLRWIWSHLVHFYNDSRSSSATIYSPGLRLKSGYWTLDGKNTLKIHHMTKADLCPPNKLF